MNETPASDSLALADPLGLGHAQLQAMIDALPFFVLLIDREHRILAINRLSTEALGQRASEVLGRFCPQAVHGLDEPFPGCPLEDAVRCGCSVERKLYDEQTQRWTLSSVYPTRLTTADGEVVYLHYARDITEEHEAGLELQRSLEHHRALAHLLQLMQSLDSSAAVLRCLVDEVLALSWMGLAQQAAGYLRQGSELRRVVARNLDPRSEQLCSLVQLGHCLCGRAAATGEVVLCDHMDARHEVRHDEMADHGHVVVPLTYDGRTLGVVSFYLPARETLDGFRLGFLRASASVAAAALRRLEMHAELIHNRYRQMQTEKLAALGRLVAGVAHEVNNPLAGLKGILWRLRRPGLSDEQKREYFDLMDGGLDRLEGVVRQLLDYARVREPRLAEHSPWELVESTVALLPGLSRHVQDTLLGPEGPEEAQAALRVEVDADQIRQALTNLLLNAVYVTPEGGQVHLRLRVELDRVGFEIRDEGPGIPEPLRDQIEAPFFTTKPEGEGTGLGLSVTRTIVDAHGGDLEFVFPVDGGTTVTLWLPSARRPAQ